MKEMGETGETSETINLKDVFDRLDAVYQQLPVTRERNPVSHSETRGKTFPDGAQVTIEHKGDQELFYVSAGYHEDRGDSITFQLDTTSIQRLAGAFSIGIGQTSLGQQRIEFTDNVWGQKVSDPKMGRTVQALVNWIGELAESETFIQPPLTSAVKP